MTTPTPGPALSLPCRVLWTRVARPATPQAVLRALPKEAQRLRALGAQLVEFHADVCLLGAPYATPVFWEQVAGILADHGLQATVHLPYIWTDLAALDQEVWEGSLRSVVTALRAVAPLQPRLAAVHPTNYATQALLQNAAPATRLSLITALAQRLVTALQRLRQEPGGEVLALENLEGMPLDLLVQVTGKAGVGICLDVGHALSNGDDPLRALRAVSGRLRGLHLHDATPPAAAGSGALGTAHLPLGRGRLDLAALVQALLQLGYTGPVVLEVDGDFTPSARTFVQTREQSAAQRRG